jgi:hypothetical protein
MFFAGGGSVWVFKRRAMTDFQFLTNDMHLVFMEK